MNKFVTVCALIALTIGLQGCATPRVVEVKQLDDKKLSCRGIKAQVAEANNFEKKARADRSITGKNVAAAVLFWPALVGTYVNTEEAIEASQDRKEHLTRLYEERDCN